MLIASKVDDIQIRDRDYILDKYGYIYKVVGDYHPRDYVVGYVKYYPDTNGDRVIFGKKYIQSTVVVRSFGLLADIPNRYIFSDFHGGIITGVPTSEIKGVYSCRRAVKIFEESRQKFKSNSNLNDLFEIIDDIKKVDALDNVGITGSLLIGCNGKDSDIDLVCYGKEGYVKMKRVFSMRSSILPYEGQNQQKLYARRARYLKGDNFKTMIKQERRKLQGLTKNKHIHVNCEPLRVDNDTLYEDKKFIEIGEISSLVRIISHQDGLFTPALYKIDVQHIFESALDDNFVFSKRIKYLISFLGAYTGTFRKNDLVHVEGKLVAIESPGKKEFGIELSPWNTMQKFSANLVS